jgi:DNA-binding Lrp family transcriptional regulator
VEGRNNSSLSVTTHASLELGFLAYYYELIILDYLRLYVPGGIAPMKALRVLLEVFVEAQELTHVGAELAKLPEVVDLYEVTGESDLVAMIETDSLDAFRDLLVRKIMQIRGVRSTTSAVILRACKEHSLPK